MISEDKAIFKARVQQWAEKLDVRVRSIVLRSMQNKWASCSSSGQLTFDTTLLDLPFHLQDYVIVHELLHRQVPNHGKLWKCLMTAYLGDYEKSESELKKYINKDQKR
jgi:predicted metal-dependent hydrolase